MSNKDPYLQLLDEHGKLQEKYITNIQNYIKLSEMYKELTEAADQLFSVAVQLKEDNIQMMEILEAIKACDEAEGLTQCNNNDGKFIQ